MVLSLLLFLSHFKEAQGLDVQKPFTFENLLSINKETTPVSA